MLEKLEQLRKEAFEKLEQVKRPEDIKALEQALLGRKGSLTLILKGIGGLSPEEKKQMGIRANTLKKELEGLLSERLEQAQQEQYRHLDADFFDTSLPGKSPRPGRLHPLTRFIQEVEDTFLAMNFEIAQGPEIEDEYHNFTALNIPQEHPARDLQDTLWCRDIPYLLRTHTSPVQVRYMETHRPPIRIVCPGRVFRKDDIDATHSPMFHQFEGLMVDRDVTLANLKGILSVALRRLISEDIELRFRTSYFPFVEPGLEVDVRSSIHKSGWLEMLGCGMVHPSVLKAAGIDPEEYQGFAFGAGIERLLMVKYQIPDIRLLYENDPRFLAQFPLRD